MLNCELVTKVKTNGKVISIGDIHGDLELMLNSLFIAKVITEVNKSKKTISLIHNDNTKHYYMWCGGNTTIVQVGDQVDRCRPFNGNLCIYKTTTPNDENSDVKILYFLTNLHKLASQYKGAVYCLLGNHELMNVMGNLDYVSYMGLNDFSSLGDGITDSRKKLFERGGKLSKFLACSRQSVIIVNSYLYVHAGFLHEIFTKLPKDSTSRLKIFNDIIKIWLLEPTTIIDKYIEDIISGSNIQSPFWTRYLGNLPPNLINDSRCDTLYDILNTLGIKGMVIGHTPQLDYGINSTCNNTLFRIDVAASKAFDKMIDFVYSSEIYK